MHPVSTALPAVDWTRLVQAAQILLDLGMAMGAAHPKSTLTVHELLDEFKTVKEKAGRSPRYLRQMKVSVNAVLEQNSLISEINTKTVEDGIASLALAPRTLRGYFLDVRTLLNFAVRRGHLATNPAAVIEPRKSPPTPPSIHTPAEVKTVLNTALSEFPDFCRLLAVRYFAGLRSAEAFRLAENEIRLDEGIIEVTAAKAKTRRRRIVEISPNLKAWLEVCGRKPIGRTSGLTSKVAAIAGVNWIRNVTRHSWCSYHLASFQSAARTALEAGHTEGVLFAHYREVVTKKSAEEFFNIYP